MNMVIYTDERDLRWHRLRDRGLEVALVAHANPGETHGESVGLSRAFDLAEKFGAIPVDHILSYELMMRYPEQFKEMMRIAGSNHTWLSTTLCVYAGEERINVTTDILDLHKSAPASFGYIEESSGGMDELVLPRQGGNSFDVLDLQDTHPWIPSKAYDLVDTLLWRAEIGLESIGWYHTPRLPDKYKWTFVEHMRDELASFIYVDVPPERRNIFNVIPYPHYALRRHGSMVRVEVDWSKAQEIAPTHLVFKDTWYQVNNSSLLPEFLHDGFKETETAFHNPTLGFFAPAEGYSSHGRTGVEHDPRNLWRISTRGEAVIIQRPIQ